MLKLTTVAWVVVLGVVSACDEGSEGATTQPNLRGCFRDDQCESGELCVFRLCSSPCSKARLCGDDAACFDTGRGSACLRATDNACIDASDCPADAACVRGRCATQCEPDDATCRNCDGGLCPPNDEVGDASVDEGVAGASVPGAAGAGGGAGGSAMCTPGSLSCRDNFVVRCNDGGRQRSERACPFVCRDGACAGNCLPGEQRCSGSLRQRCDEAGNWMTQETCGNACTPAACTETCADGTRQCDGNTVTICRAARQIDVQRCEYVCLDGSCAGSCTPGSRQCRDNAVITCSAEGVWGMPVACVNACIGAACSGECAPGAQRCGSNTSYQVCNARGQWSGNVECREQACVEGECSGECSPGETRCEAATALSTCGADGQWGVPNECPGQACNDGRCEGACTPASQRCNPDDASQTQLCTPSGEWRNGPRCAPAETCLDGTCTGVCAPGTRRCVPGNSASFQACGDAGEWGPPVACGDGVSCGGEGTCGEDACATGQLPEWFGMSSGVDRSLDDPRWGGALDQFSNGSGAMMPAGYAVVYDQESSTLAVTVRALGSDMPTPDDFAYFGIASSAGTDGVAVRIELTMPGNEPDPRPLPSITGYRLQANAWSEIGGRREYLSGTSAWLDSDELAWAVSFHLDVRTAGLDPGSPVRMAAGVHIENNAGPMESLTPTSLDVSNPLGERAQEWPIVNLSAIECTGRVALP